MDVQVLVTYPGNVGVLKLVLTDSGAGKISPV